MSNEKLPFVIGAGIGRTGTLSLQTALNQLGYKSFHMTEILVKGAAMNSWVDVAEAELGQVNNSLTKRKEVVQEVIDMGYNATTDFPICLLYRELMELVPDAKVILSVRTSGDVWSESILNTIGNAGTAFSRAPFQFIPHFRRFTKIDNWLWREIGIGPQRPFHKDELETAYDEWNESVIKSVPNDRLLIHQSRDGFAPICKHLGVPDTECPRDYPNVNDSASFKIKLVVARSVTVSFWALVIGIMAFMLRKMTNRTHKIKSF